jgi:hypothetical protein
LTFRQYPLYGGFLVVQGGRDNIVSPPVGWRCVRKSEAKEYYYGRNR